MQELLTTKDVSQILRVKEQTVRLWACRRKIPSYKVFGALRFKVDDIEALVNASASVSYQSKIEKILLKI